MLMLQLLTGLAAVIVSATVVVLLNDQPRLSTAPNFIAWVRCHGRRLGLVLMGAGAAMAILKLLTDREVSLEVIVLITAIALRQVAHPKGWVAFVRRGDSAGVPGA